jgi:hypothetical protein
MAGTMQKKPKNIDASKYGQAFGVIFISSCFHAGFPASLLFSG